MERSSLSGSLLRGLFSHSCSVSVQHFISRKKIKSREKKSAIKKSSPNLCRLTHHDGQIRLRALSMFMSMLLYWEPWNTLVLYWLCAPLSLSLCVSFLCGYTRLWESKYHLICINSPFLFITVRALECRRRRSACEGPPQAGETPVVAVTPLLCSTTPASQPLPPPPPLPPSLSY